MATTRASHPVVLWGIFGVLALIGRALYRLTPMALELTSGAPLAIGHQVFLLGWVAFMVYAEGYKGFHKAFSPRVVLRLHELAKNPSRADFVLAPLIGMGLLRATKKRLIVSWCLVLGIVALIAFVSQLGYPYRPIVDLGVVLGLTVGSLSLVFHYLRATRGYLPDMASDMK